MSINSNSSTTDTQQRLGWVSEPNVRGTIEIIWSCLLVIFACVWTVLHPNVPAPSEGWWRVVFREAKWAALAVCTPELLSLFAIMQWNAANTSVAQMHDLGYTEWTMVHAFFANAGGFVLEPIDSRAFPINATSIFYLMSCGRISVPKIKRADIWDRSKADVFAKYVAFVQTGWFLCMVIGRGIQKLPVTPIELFIIAFIAPTMATQYFWAKKPQNVTAPILIKVDWAIAEVLRDAGEAAKEPYIDTPMDFIEKPVWDGWKRRPCFAYYGHLDTRPLTRIPNDYSPPPPTGKEAVFIWIVSVVHASIHMIGWEFSFPTRTELILWRTSSLVLLIVLALGGVVPVLSTRSWFDFEINLLWIWVREAKKKIWARVWVLTTLVDAAYAPYILARLVIFAELIATFRSLPAEAYTDVNWSQLLPHV